jgi:hypothetical protein
MPSQEKLKVIKPQALALLSPYRLPFVYIVQQYRQQGLQNNYPQLA